MLDYFELTSMRSDGSIPAIELCCSSNQLPFARTKYLHWRFDLEKGQHLTVSHPRNVWSFCIWLLNGDIDTYMDGELTTTQNQAAIVRKYRELGISLPDDQGDEITFDAAVKIDEYPSNKGFFYSWLEKDGEELPLSDMVSNFTNEFKQGSRVLFTVRGLQP